MQKHEMGILKILKKSRYSSNPTHFHGTGLFSDSHPTFSAICSTGNPFIPQNYSFIASKSYLLNNLSSGLHLSFQSACISFASDRCSSNFSRNNCGFRLFSSSIIETNTHGKAVNTLDENKGSCDEISRIIDIIRNEGSDEESRLDLIGSNLSRQSVIEILCALNKLNVPALQFFEWMRALYPEHSRNGDICSLVVDNCGRLGDYSTMRSVLKDFRARKICLTEKAFGFLLMSTTVGRKKSIAGVVATLNQVGGSCRSSGIHSLVQMLCSLNLIDLVKFVMEITERKASYYSVLIKHICVKGRFEDVRDVLGEMRQLRCDPDSTAYNYLISTLCKQGRIDEAFSAFKEMLDTGCCPDQVTFEILIYFACKHGRSDCAVMLYGQMVSRGIKPRLPTHGAFIRGYFSSQRFEEAYRYVVDTSAKEKWAAEHVYIILASLHIEHGDLLIAHKLLVEMIEKGLMPKHSIYNRASNRLRKTGRSNLAKSLDTLYSGLRNSVKMMGDQASLSSM